MKYKILIIKNRLENIIIFPFILIGYLFYSIGKKKKNYYNFFFFPFYHTGGAEKVHSQIAEAVGNEQSVIFFTRKSKDDTFLKNFTKTKCIIKDISAFTDNKWLYFLNIIYRGYISAWVNAQKSTTIVFNGQSNFGYKISPWVKGKIVQLELIHALNTFSFIRIPFIKNYLTTLTVSNEIINKHLTAYKNIGIPTILMAKFKAIETRIELPEKIVSKDYYIPALRLMYVGRGTPEKRVHLVAKIAEKILSQNLPIEFHFAGDVEKSIQKSALNNCIFHGNINSEKDLNKLYDNAHVLIVTSETESGPLVIMEAMARGLAIITTNVGFVSAYIENDINGFKIAPDTDENLIVNSMSSYIVNLFIKRGKLARIGDLNAKTAYENFGLDSFRLAYQKLFRKFAP